MGVLTRFHKPKTASLYRTVGGGDVLEVVVEDFYCRVLEDDHLATFFAGSDMRRLKSKYVELLAATLGGPNPYTGRSMKQAHRGRGITMHHFALLVGHLRDSLSAAGVSPAAIDEIVGVIAPMATDIASDHAAAGL
jgi:hemoglobin